MSNQQPPHLWFIAGQIVQLRGMEIRGPLCVLADAVEAARQHGVPSRQVAYRSRSGWTFASHFRQAVDAATVFEWIRRRYPGGSDVFELLRRTQGGREWPV